MPTREEIIRELRTWKGTPYLRGHALRGAGCDCGGFIGAAVKATGVLPDIDFAMQWRTDESAGTLLTMLTEHTDVAPEGAIIRPVDLLALGNERDLIRARREGRAPLRLHLVVVTELLPYRKIIHSDPEHGVVEHRLDDAAMRGLHSHWTFRGLP